MKEIKFRVWDKETNKMYFQLNESPCFGLFEGDRAASIEDVFFYEKQRFELMQYAGLKDKNGKEIYDGDVVKNSRCGSNRLMHVKWTDAIEEVSISGCEWTRQNPGFVFENISKGMTYVFIANKDLEVIGNIYENPELLEEIQNARD